jgi:hypothetical protein
MNKIKVEDMACFEQVTKVIGVANAKRELFVAMQGYTSVNFPVSEHSSLCLSFGWEGTSQGYIFWNKIDDGINPYK